MDYLAKGVVFWLSVYLYAGQILVDSLSPVPLSRVSAGKFPDGDVLEPVTTAISTGVECGGKIFANQGQIISPGYPVQNYSSRSNCTWSITADEGKLLLMNFEYIDIEVGPPDCPYDGVIVVDNAGMAPVQFTPGPNPFGAAWTGPTPIVIGKYCGRDKFPAFTSVTNSVQLGFYSDVDVQMGGFLFTWKTLDVRSSALHSCDFENGLCSGWENVNTREDVFDWTVTKGSTPTKKTGPGFDHTKGNQDGSYAFIESSKPRKENDTALLASPQITFRDEDTSYCLEFWYHMHGKTMGSLIVGFAIGDRRLIEWRVSGDQGDEWKHALVSIKKIDEPMKVIFAGVIGRSYTADIAIDDIKVYEKPCSEVNWKDNMPCENEEDYPCENSTTCIPDAKMCDGTADCPGKDDESGHLCISVAPTTSFPLPPIFTTEMEETTVDGMTADYYTTADLETTASNDETTTQYVEEPTTADELLLTTVGVATTISDVVVATTDDLLATDAVAVTTDVSTTGVYIPTDVAASGVSTETIDEGAYFETTESSEADATTTQEFEATTQEVIKSQEETTADSIGFTTKSSPSDGEFITTGDNVWLKQNYPLITTKFTPAASPESTTTRFNGVNNLILASKPSSSTAKSTTVASASVKTTSVVKASTTNSPPRTVRSTARPTSNTPNTPDKKSESATTSKIPETTQIHITGNIQAPTAAEKQRGSAQSTAPISLCILLFSGLLSLLLIQA